MCPSLPGLQFASGLSGTIAATTATQVNTWSATCGSYTISATTTKSYYTIDLSAYPVGGPLTISNCGLSSADTMLFVGTGCPTNATSFNCVGSADDSCGAQSQVTISATTSNRYFAMFAPYNSGVISTGMTW